MRHCRNALALALLGFLAGCATGTVPGRVNSPELNVEAEAGRQVVKRAWLRVAVTDLDSASNEVARVVALANGVVQSSATEGENTVDLDLRVPATLLDTVLARLRALGKVRDERMTTEDVTRTMSDNDARLTNLVAVRDRLRAYLDQAKAMEDIIAIERELTRVQTEIDELTAETQRLRGQVAQSEIDLTLERKHVLGPLGLLLSGAAWLVGKLFVIH